MNLEDPISSLLWLPISWRSMLSTVTFPKPDEIQIITRGIVQIVQLILDGPFNPPLNCRSLTSSLAPALRGFPGIPSRVPGSPLTLTPPAARWPRSAQSCPNCACAALQRAAELENAH